jgi:hypothetical protein
MHSARLARVSGRRQIGPAGSAGWPDRWSPVHRHHVGACELPIDASPSTVAAAMRQNEQRGPTPRDCRNGRTAAAPADIHRFVAISCLWARMRSARTSAGTGVSGEKRIVPLARSNPSSRSLTASIAAGLNGKLLRGAEAEQRAPAVDERGHAVARALLGIRREPSDHGPHAFQRDLFRRLQVIEVVIHCGHAPIISHRRANARAGRKEVASALGL